ncbi:MAG: amidohydrolase, partial [Nitrososphaerales archaeon]
HLLGMAESAVQQSETEPALRFYPGPTIDTHAHLVQAAYAVYDVQIDSVKDIPELIQLIRERALVTPEGTWIRTSAAWHEMNLKERRFPTAKELDAATTKHPILVKRGGHNDVVNSMALKIAGITKDTPDPKGGTIVRDKNGEPNGWLIQSAAQQLVERFIPSLPTEKQIEGARLAALNFAAQGITTVRDGAVGKDEMLSLLQGPWEKGNLPIRVRAMISLIRGTVPEQIAAIDGWGVSSGFGDDFLRIWGLKVVMDGGAEAAALLEPYANKPGYKGFLFWKSEDLIQVANHAVRRGWKIGTHCVGDLAVKTILDVYERVIQDNSDLPHGMLVLEHAFLADKEQRSRAIRLGIPVTIQYPPIYTLGAELVENFGEQRASTLLPVRKWIDEGAQVSAGSDYPAGQSNPLRSVWGLVTRQTGGNGIVGGENAITREEAFKLYTSEAAKFLGEENSIGSLEPGKLADFVAYEKDPFICSDEELKELDPLLTVVDGKAVYDPNHILN